MLELFNLLLFLTSAYLIYFCSSLRIRTMQGIDKARILLKNPKTLLKVSATDVRLRYKALLVLLSVLFTDLLLKRGEQGWLVFVMVFIRVCLE